MSFNRTTISSLHALAVAVETPIPSSWIGDRDRFPAWTLIDTERTPGGARWLMRNGRGGLAWILVDNDGMACGYAIITDDEARALWPRLILQFRAAEEAALVRALRPGAQLEAAIEAALGGTALLQCVWLDDEDCGDGTIRRQALAHLRGVVRAWVRQDGRIVRAELVTGQEAWALVRPIVDP